MEATIANSKRNKQEKDKEADYKKVPDDVLEALKGHPSNLSRAASIKKYIANSMNLRSLAAKGKSQLNTVFVRNWSYDDDSESTVISDNFTSPDKAGSRENGMTGIDVDESLGF